MVQKTTLEALETFQRESTFAAAAADRDHNNSTLLVPPSLS